MITPHIILGPPGTGKTTKLLSIMEELLDSGTEPERIAFVSFTKKAANEAAERAQKRFSLRASRLPYFRTLHSIAYGELGINQSGLMKITQYEEIGASLGLEFTGRYSMDDGMPTGACDGDKLLFVDSFARARMIPLRDAWQELGDTSISWHALKQFHETLLAFKLNSGLVDFTDMLERYTQKCNPLPIDVAIIDEAQDLSTLQWKMVRHAVKNAKKVYIAGDDDQAIYKWSGADIEQFLNLKGTTEVLGHSYRLPRSVYNLANKLSNRIKHRYSKEWKPRDEEGQVQYLVGPHNVDLTTDSGSWLLLARNTYMLKQLQEIARIQGVPYYYRGNSSIRPSHAAAIKAWEQLSSGEELLLEDVKACYEQIKSGPTGIKRGHKQLKDVPDNQFYSLKELREEHGLLAQGDWFDALSGIPLEDRVYYQSIQDKGHALTKPPAVSINTIHSVKGGEADNVLLMTDLAYRTHLAYQRAPDDEHRVFYVGVTRTRRNLYLVGPTDRFSYGI